MNIGIIGAGNMGSGLGKIWAGQGHNVLFSFAREEKTLKELAAAVGPAARAGMPADAANFGEVIFFSVPWNAVEEALAAAGMLDGKIVISCVNALKPDFSGLEVGTTDSAAEVVARRIPGAKVVEALFPNASVLNAADRQFAGVTPTQFYCGDDADAKGVVADLIRVVGLDPVDIGPLRNARYLEPAGMLLAQLAYALGKGPNIALKLLER